MGNVRSKFNNMSINIHNYIQNINNSKIFVYFMKTKKNRNFRNKTSRVYAIPSCDKDIKGVIDVNAIRNNINYLKKKTGCDLMPVLKADAYGHGIVEIAKIVRKIGIKYIFYICCVKFYKNVFIFIKLFTKDMVFGLSLIVF